MIDVELVYMKNIEKDGKIVDARRLKREIITVEELTRKEIEKHIDLGDADFVDVFYFSPVQGSWVYGGSYTRFGWIFSLFD